MTLSVIGAGLNRTGTLSLKLALEQLGFGPCYHMVELERNPVVWEPVFEEQQPVDWDKVYAGYQSAVDVPTSLFYRELASTYPQAKVILTVRDPESWWKSARATTASEANLNRIGGLPLVTLFNKAFEYFMKRGILPDAPPDRDEAVAWFEQHTRNVQKEIDPERLLVFEVPQGWPPLCRFLDVPIPATPFPKVNSTEEFRAILGLSDYK